ncbi:MAG: alpha/beta hydrolase [Firmicutes bacterium]|nr:alpha/beta hydrolase [Bacillota bacterium]
MSEHYELIDQSMLLRYLFYPHRQHSKPREGAFDLSVPVEANVDIICRAYPAAANGPWILYFHGNGEVVSDYDGIAPLYKNRHLNLLVADYRGYGASGGTPTFGDLVADARIIFEYMVAELPAEIKSDQWFVMGRSLGSISALELAAAYPDQIGGLVVESGFISVAGLINHLGLPSPGDLSGLERFYRELAASISLPALVIHGERDSLVPLHQGRDLFEALGSQQKEMVTISFADHNDIMFVDSQKYMSAIEDFIRRN